MSDLDFKLDKDLFNCLQTYLHLEAPKDLNTDSDLNTLVGNSLEKLTVENLPEEDGSDKNTVFTQVSKIAKELHQISVELGTEGKEIAAIAQPLLEEGGNELASFASFFVGWVLKPKADPNAQPDRGPRDRTPRDNNRGPRDNNRGPRDNNRGPRDNNRGPRNNNRTGGGRDRGPRDNNRGGNFKRGKNSKTPEEAKASATVENGIRALKANGNLREIDLEPSNSFHRRLQHQSVKGTGFYSYSKGEADERCVVLTREKPIPKDDFHEDEID